MEGKGGGEWPVIGIDLGMMYSCVAVWQHDRVEIIPNDQGNRTTPCVAFTNSDCLIGEVALNQSTKNPFNNIFDVVVSGSGDGSCALWDLRCKHRNESWMMPTEQVNEAHTSAKRKRFVEGKAAFMDVTSVLYLKDELSSATAGAFDRFGSYKMSNPTTVTTTGR